MSERFLINDIWIKENAIGIRNIWCAEQFAILGIDYPPPPGWMGIVRNRDISLEDKARFEDVGAKRRAELRMRADADPEELAKQPKAKFKIAGPTLYDDLTEDAHG